MIYDFPTLASEKPISANFSEKLDNRFDRLGEMANALVLRFFQPGAPGASVVLGIVATEAFTLPVGLTNSQARATVAATASKTFNVQKNGATVGTIVFAAAATTATFTLASATSFAAGDILTIVAPASPDATLANVAITLLGTRV